jgi:hypothetical protein
MRAGVSVRERTLPKPSKHMRSSFPQFHARPGLTLSTSRRRKPATGKQAAYSVLMLLLSCEVQISRAEAVSLECRRILSNRKHGI